MKNYFLTYPCGRCDWVDFNNSKQFKISNCSAFQHGVSKSIAIKELYG